MKNPHRTSQHRGFTLIEIMVVISIIASISSVVLVGVRAAQASGRDAVRGSNTLQVRNALALYQADHGGVPVGNLTDCPTTYTSTDANGSPHTNYVCKSSGATNGLSNVLQPLIDGKYISHIPVDSVNTSGLEYQYITSQPTGTTNSNSLGTVQITDAAAFGYVSELKSVDPVTKPTVVVVPIGNGNTNSYPTSGGYPTPRPAVAQALVTGPSTVLPGSYETWTVDYSNPNANQLGYYADWGDYNSDGANYTSESPITMSHVYGTPGTYHVTFAVYNENGDLLDSKAITVNVVETGFRTLTVSVQGYTGDIVTSSPAGINCATGQTCTHDFALNSTVTLSATHGPNSHLFTWTTAGNTSAFDLRNPLPVTMDTGRSATAYFDTP